MSNTHNSFLANTASTYSSNTILNSSSNAASFSGNKTSSSVPAFVRHVSLPFSPAKPSQSSSMTYNSSSSLSTDSRYPSSSFSSYSPGLGVSGTSNTSITSLTSFRPQNDSKQTPPTSTAMSSFAPSPSPSHSSSISSSLSSPSSFSYSSSIGTAKLLNSLKKYFGFQTFRPYQEEVIRACLSCRDSFIVMSTGSGKSLCYQFPPLVLNRPAIVISPLIALMNDQVRALQSRGIRACALHSLENDKNVWAAAQSGGMSLIYMAPERIQLWLPALRSLITSVGVSLIAIDECHCISEWGSDFRPLYRTNLLLLRDFLRQENFSNIPLMCLTATATKKVQLDVCSLLSLRQGYLTIVSSFDRPNLYYSVKLKNTYTKDITRQLFGDGSAIIYCGRISDTELLANHLKSLSLTSAPYHADLDGETRKKVHQAFMSDDIQIVCATVAYGMGIDKHDVRHIVHYGLPKSVEAYVQQAGRAGRDGEPSRCTLFYSGADYNRSMFLIRRDNSNNSAAALESLREMNKYVNLNTCRRRYLLEFFHESYPKTNCGSCDVCVAVASNQLIEISLQEEARAFCLAMYESGERFGKMTVRNIVKGSKTQELQIKLHSVNKTAEQMQSFGKLKHYERSHLDALWSIFDSAHFFESKPAIAHMQPTYQLSEKGRLVMNGMPLEPFKVNANIAEILNNGTRKRHSKAGISFNSMSASSASSSAHSSQYSSPLNSDEERLLQLLIQIRKEASKAESLSPYMLFEIGQLRLMCMHRPLDQRHLTQLQGITKQKAEKFGPPFLKAINAFVQTEQLKGNVGILVDGEDENHDGGLTEVLQSEEANKSINSLNNNNTLQGFDQPPSLGSPVTPSKLIHVTTSAATNATSVTWPSADSGAAPMLTVPTSSSFSSSAVALQAFAGKPSAMQAKIQSERDATRIPAQNILNVQNFDVRIHHPAALWTDNISFTLPVASGTTITHGQLSAKYSPTANSDDMFLLPAEHQPLHRADPLTSFRSAGESIILHNESQTTSLTASGVVEDDAVFLDDSACQPSASQSQTLQGTRKIYSNQLNWHAAPTLDASLLSQRKRLRNDSRGNVLDNPGLQSTTSLSSSSSTGVGGISEKRTKARLSVLAYEVSDLRPRYGAVPRLSARDFKPISVAQLSVFRLLLDGLSPSQISEKRTIRVSTIYEYIAECILEGYYPSFEVMDELLNPAIRQEIFAVIEESYGSFVSKEAPPPLKEFKGLLREEIGYEPIRLALAVYRLRAANTQLEIDENAWRHEKKAKETEAKANALQIEMEVVEKENVMPQRTQSTHLDSADGSSTNPLAKKNKSELGESNNENVSATSALMEIDIYPPAKSAATAPAALSDIPATASSSSTTPSVKVEKSAADDLLDELHE